MWPPSRRPTGIRILSRSPPVVLGVALVDLALLLTSEGPLDSVRERAIDVLLGHRRRRDPALRWTMSTSFSLALVPSATRCCSRNNARLLAEAITAKARSIPGSLAKLAESCIRVTESR